MTWKKTTETSKKEIRGPLYFAQLARVGHNKRKALAYQEEAEFYFTIATEALAGFEVLLECLKKVEQMEPSLTPFVAKHTSKQHQLIKSLLNFWPKNTDSQERVLSLLDSDGLAATLEFTPEGFASLSMDRILENVERCIEATKQESNPSP